MSTQKVTEKILEDANREAQEILEKHQTEASNIERDYEDRIEKKKQQIDQEVQERKKVEIMRALSQHRLDLNKKLTEQKQKLITSIIDQAINQLIKREEYLDFLKALIKKSGEKNGELLLNKTDAKRFHEDLKEFANKHELNLKVTSDENIRGGIILRKQRTNYIGSLDIILELLSDELAILVSKELFQIQSKRKGA